MSTLKWLDAPTGPVPYWWRAAPDARVQVAEVRVIGNELRVRFPWGSWTPVEEVPGQWLPIPSPAVLIAMGVLEEHSHCANYCKSGAGLAGRRCTCGHDAALAALDKAREEKA